jgi:phospholipase C
MLPGMSEGSQAEDDARTAWTYAINDDTHGWYDHQVSPQVNGSNDPATDQLVCTSTPMRLGSFPDRCGYGQRVPFLVISPYTRANFVSHIQIDQSSVPGFIEDNWLRGQRIGGGSYDAVAGSIAGRDGLLDFHDRPNDNRILLDPTTGVVVSRIH